MCELKLDTSIRPEFETYCGRFETAEGEVEVWACKSSDYFGISQTNARGEEDIVMFDKSKLLSLKELVGQAVEILEVKDEKG